MHNKQMCLITYGNRVTAMVSSESAVAGVPIAIEESPVACAPSAGASLRLRSLPPSSTSPSHLLLPMAMELSPEASAFSRIAIVLSALSLELLPIPTAWAAVASAVQGLQEEEMRRQWRMMRYACL